MNQLIGLLLPSIVSLRIYDKIYGEEKCIRTRVENTTVSVDTTSTAEPNNVETNTNEAQQ